MTVTLFPIRLLIAAFMMLLAWPFAFLASVGRSETTVEPQCLWRRLVDIILRVIMRIMWFAGGFHWITVKGQRALPREAPIITLAPHSSYFDAIPVTMTMSSIVMKAESKDIPVWGTLIKYIRPVFVSRSDQNSRKKTVEEIKRRAHYGGDWPQVMIFPEGTCTNRSCLITFKPGAFIPGVPVQPVVIRYPNKLDTITWTWQGPGAYFLPIYTPSEEEKRNPALFAVNVRRVMAKALGVPITDYSFEDCQLAMAEGQLRLPVDTCLLEFAKLVRRLGLKPQNTEKVLQEYGNRARKLEGQKLALEDFAHFLDVPVSDMLRDMFALFDEVKALLTQLQEYVIALSVVCRPAKTLETMKLAFKVGFDSFCKLSRVFQSRSQLPTAEAPPQFLAPPPASRRSSCRAFSPAVHRATRVNASGGAPRRLSKNLVQIGPCVEEIRPMYYLRGRSGVKLHLKPVGLFRGEQRSYISSLVPIG
uniref:Lysophosphatidylcholine acyltransferase 1 n=1 Tax=Xiphophorus maculatus TaxID=8083 RepID=M3ZSU6_XIPMA